MSMDKFKYILNPDNVYILVFEGYRGEPVKAEIKGSDIIARLRRDYLLDDMLDSMGNDERKD